MYRYRYQRGLSDLVSPRAMKHLSKLGKLTSVKGYSYRGRYGINEAVLVKGEKGSARFNGVCWGYFGSGPNALFRLLRLVGLDKAAAYSFAFCKPRSDKPATSWQCALNHQVPEVTKTKSPNIEKCDHCKHSVYPPNACYTVGEKTYCSEYCVEESLKQPVAGEAEFLRSLPA